MQDPSYVSVYVPASSSDYQQNQQSSSPAFKRKNLRRCWNSLSRLQKSFFLMTVLILVVFSLFAVTVTRSPQSNSFSDGYKENIRAGADPGSGLRDAVIADPVETLHLQSNTYSSSQKPWDEVEAIFQKNHRRLSKPTDAVPTIPRALQPDFVDSHGNGYNRNGVSNQVAENIRSMISLDPVIPLNNFRKSTRPPGSPITKEFKPEWRSIKFKGPQNPRQQAVVDAFLHAWKGYKTYAWGMDHLRPISGGGQDWFGLGLTLVDSLDTMLIMGLQNEFFEARDWVDSSLSFDINKNVNLFETTIRVLGGLLSAYHLSGDKMFLEKAEELGTILLVGYKTPSGVPFSDINLRTKTAHGPTWNPDSTTSEVSTVQVEMRDLSRATNNPVFEITAMNVSRHIHNLPKTQGLVGIHISPSTGKFRSSSVITLGARGDSYYEYLLKQWIQSGKTIDFLKDDYMLAVEGIRHKLVRKTTFSNLTYIGELDNGGKVFRPKMDHLVCFLSGTLALGCSHGIGTNEHIDLAKDLLKTCYETYHRTPTGLSPEIVYFKTEEDDSDFFIKSNDAHNLLRPETVESLWYLYQITGDKMYQTWGWEIFQAFLKHTKVANGFTSIGSVLHPENPRPRDMMESFFLGETLKYFYLLFSDEPIFDLKQWVFNTEAHPLPIYDH